MYYGADEELEARYWRKIEDWLDPVFDEEGKSVSSD